MMYTSCGKWVVFEMQTCFFIVVDFKIFIPVFRCWRKNSMVFAENR